MASNCEYQDTDNLEHNNSQDSAEENSNSEKITLQAEKYLQSDDVKFCSDPKLKREKQKLEDLLASYKNIISKLDRKCNNKSDKIAEEKRLSKIPEIYAVLHPEIYKNSREEEKKRLAHKFSKRQFSFADRVVPTTCRTPLMNITDKREEEKDRLRKVLSNSPEQILNVYDSQVSSRSPRRPCYLNLSPVPLNERENEKDRFIKLLMNSGTYHKSHLDQNSNSLLNRKFNKTKLFVEAEKPVKNSLTKKTMDRTENSHFTSKQYIESKENEEKQHKLVGFKKKGPGNNVSDLSKHTRAKLDKALSTTDLGFVDEEDSSLYIDTTVSGRKRYSSVSTQTEPSDVASLKEDIKTFEEEVDMKPLSPPSTEEKKVYFLSPREKLMSDLHCVSHCLPGLSPNSIMRDDIQVDTKLQRAAYRKALQEQIQEKKNLEEARKRKEKEQDYLSEQRLRLQQERMEYEFHEQRKKEDWKAQATGLRPTGNHDTTKMAAPLVDADHQNVLSNVQHENGISICSTRCVESNKYKEDKNVDKTRAEELMKAPIDFQIDRPPSPPLPAVHTRAIMKNNTKVLEEKWKLPKEGNELDRTQIGVRDCLLTQLGAFRRQLHQEHIKLEARLQKQQTP